jgi:hypothetical protein
MPTPDVSAMPPLMDIETLSSYLVLARRLASDIDEVVERRRAAVAILALEGSDTSQARHLLDVAEELQRMIWDDKEQLENELQELLKRQDGQSPST